MKTILGTGQLGLAIMQLLLDKNPNENILMVNRTGKLNISIPQNVQVTAADVTSKTDMAAIARKSDLIFSCTDMPYNKWAEFYPATANALAYALSETNARLVFADNLYSYGNVAGKEMNEQMPHTAKTKKGKIRAGVIHTLHEFTKVYSVQIFCIVFTMEKKQGCVEILHYRTHSHILMTLQHLL